jgi:hypothetical protein
MMSLLDKAKAAAEKMATEAKKGASQVQGKIEQTQTSRKADQLASQLGYLIVRERTGGEPAGAEADRLVQEISALRAQLQGEEADGSGPTSPASASEPAQGDFQARLMAMVPACVMGIAAAALRMLEWHSVVTK